MKKTLLILSIITAFAISSSIGNAVAHSCESAKAGVITAFVLFSGSIVLGYAYRNQTGLLYGCAPLANGFIQTCDTSSVNGLEYEFYYFNREDIDLDATTFGADGQIDNLVLLAGKVGYLFSARGTANDVEINMVKGNTTNNNWDHIYNTLIVGNNAITKKNIIKKMPDSDGVIVINNKWKTTTTTGDSAFEAIGFSVGLTGRGISRKSKDTGTKAAWQVQLGSPEGQTENNPGINVDAGDYTTTKQMLDNLL
jgi:hypothetical protein